MMLRQALALFVFALLLGPGVGHAEQFRPSNYDECITDSMRGVGSDVAARAIIESCRNQFPTSVAQQEPPPAQPAEEPPQQATVASETSRNLTSAELKNLKSSAFVIADSYRVTIENMNENVTVTEVTVAIWHTAAPDARRSYIRPVMVLPQGTGRVTVKDVVPSTQYDSTWSDGSEMQWSIVSAMGNDQTPQ